MEPLFLTIRETAEALRVSRARVYELIKSGELLAVRVGGSKTTRIRRTDLEDYAAGLSTNRAVSA